jgi:magnesium transporter
MNVLLEPSLPPAPVGASLAPRSASAPRARHADATAADHLLAQVPVVPSAVAFFIPGIVYRADAIGTQTEAVAVRSLSFQRPDILRTFCGELRTGVLLGLTLATPVVPAIYYLFGDLRLGLAVGAAILCAGTLATGIGFAFPLLLARCNRDPALGSGPLATVVQDVLSLVAHFLAIRAFAAGS